MSRTSQHDTNRRTDRQVSHDFVQANIQVLEVTAWNGLKLKQSEQSCVKTTDTYRCANTLKDMHVSLSITLVGLIYDSEENEVVVYLPTIILKYSSRFLNKMDRKSLQLLLKK